MDDELAVFVRTYSKDRLGSLLHYVKDLSAEEELRMKAFMRIRINSNIKDSEAAKIKEEILWAEGILEKRKIDPGKKDFPRTQQWLHS